MLGEVVGKIILIGYLAGRDYAGHRGRNLSDPAQCLDARQLVHVKIEQNQPERFMFSGDNRQAALA